MNWKIILLIVFGLAMISSLFKNDAPTSSSSTTKESTGFDYNYAKNRFKQEGYSDKDARTAAEAVLKFEAAQRNRGK
jgi:hypothetical protein